jgi:hypothetical protein
MLLQHVHGKNGQSCNEFCVAALASVLLWVSQVNGNPSHLKL